MNRIGDFVEGTKGLIEGALLASELARSTTPKIDERFMQKAQKATAAPGSFFTSVPWSSLEGEARPESIRHDLTLLPPNPYDSTEVDAALGLVNMMLGDETTQQLTATFTDYATEHDIFERMRATPNKAGEKFVVVSNHLQLPDQGFTMGLLHNAARAKQVDRLEHHLTVVVGRLIGYYQLGETNVVDGILRKAGSVLKTFPKGSEAMREEDNPDAERDEKILSTFRAICNHRTKQVFEDLVQSREGHIICMAPSGEQDKEHEDSVVMSRFGKGTNEMLEAASQRGATVIPAFVDYGFDQSVVRLLDPIPGYAIKDTSDCDHIGEAIAAAGSFARGEAHVRNPDITRFGKKVLYHTA